MRKLVLVVILLVALVVPCLASAVNMWCELALVTGKLSDWIACGVVAIMMNEGVGLQNGYDVYY